MRNCRKKVDNFQILFHQLIETAINFAAYKIISLIIDLLYIVF